MRVLKFAWSTLILLNAIFVKAKYEIEISLFSIYNSCSNTISAFLTAYFNIVSIIFDNRLQLCCKIRNFTVSKFFCISKFDNFDVLDIWFVNISCRVIVKKENGMKISFLPKGVEKKALLFFSCEKKNWKKSLFFLQTMCHFFFSCEKNNWEKSPLFSYMKRKIEKNFFPFLTWEGKGDKISSLFLSFNDHPDFLRSILMRNTLCMKYLCMMFFITICTFYLNIRTYLIRFTRAAFIIVRIIYICTELTFC